MSCWTVFLLIENDDRHGCFTAFSKIVTCGAIVSYIYQCIIYLFFSGTEVIELP